MLIHLLLLTFFQLQAKSDSNISRVNYEDRYKLTNVYEKLVDNKGNGFEPLYGTRNVRVVFHGIYYRSGANNYYHRTNKRANMNPMPNDGLLNLCQEGFKKAIYFYEENFDTAPKLTRCQDIEGNYNELKYVQLNPSDPEQMRLILETIHEAISDPSQGPILGHCWNGWHASGIAATFALRQFCGWTGEEGVSYWDQNTDGNNQDPPYERFRTKIREFEPYRDLKISRKRQREICPQP
ncbi:MAG: hypothetical protein KDD25_05805 [Bdellovibrionales bacterium]|nr:hypothetical protein [Bdellovibrionales bacterium]